MHPLLPLDANMALTPWLATAAHLPYYWHLPILVIIISLVYSATRFDEWGSILREAVRWGIRLIVFLAIIAVVLYIVATTLI